MIWWWTSIHCAFNCYCQQNSHAFASFADSLGPLMHLDQPTPALAMPSTQARPLQRYTTADKQQLVIYTNAQAWPMCLQVKNPWTVLKPPTSLQVSPLQTWSFKDDWIWINGVMGCKWIVLRWLADGQWGAVEAGTWPLGRPYSQWLEVGTLLLELPPSVRVEPGGREQAHISLDFLLDIWTSDLESN